jgi:hypothetical protein
MVEIGKREGVGKRYVSRMIHLAFLAPAIIEGIVEGRQPPELTAQFLSTGRGDLPLSWHAQEKLLGCTISDERSFGGGSAPNKVCHCSRSLRGIHFAESIQAKFGLNAPLGFGPYGPGGTGIVAGASIAAAKR